MYRYESMPYLLAFCYNIRRVLRFVQEKVQVYDGQRKWGHGGEKQVRYRGANKLVDKSWPYARPRAHMKLDLAHSSNFNGIQSFPKNLVIFWSTMFLDRAPDVAADKFETWSWTVVLTLPGACHCHAAYLTRKQATPLKPFTIDFYHPRTSIELCCISVCRHRLKSLK